MPRRTKALEKLHYGFSYPGMRIAIVGARGMPLPGKSFGGFETFIGGLAPRLAERGHDVTVYCRKSLYPDHPSEYGGVHLVWLPAIETKVFTIS